MTGRSLVVLFFLLLLATSASAECALVLWEEYETRDAQLRSEKSWAVQVARPDHAACEDVLRRVWQLEVKPGNRVLSGRASRRRSRHRDS